MKEETNKMESIEGGAMEEARHSSGGSKPTKPYKWVNGAATCKQDKAKVSFTSWKESSWKF